MRAKQQRYEQTAKGRATRYRYRHSAKGLATSRVWQKKKYDRDWRFRLEHNMTQNARKRAVTRERQKASAFPLDLGAFLGPVSQ